MVKHYVYSYPWFLPDGTPIREEYELYDKDGNFVAVYYTNPDPSLPEELIID